MELRITVPHTFVSTQLFLFHKENHVRLSFDAYSYHTLEYVKPSVKFVLMRQTSILQFYLFPLVIAFVVMPTCQMGGTHGEQKHDYKSCMKCLYMLESTDIT
jgi:hypothetical protein